MINNFFNYDYRCLFFFGHAFPALLQYLSVYSEVFSLSIRDIDALTIGLLKPVCLIEIQLWQKRKYHAYSPFHETWNFLFGIKIRKWQHISLGRDDWTTR